MEKNITVSIDNITEDAFLAAWNSDYVPEVYEQSDKIILTVANDKEAVVDEITVFAEKAGLNCHIFYQGYDFTEADSDNSPLLEMAYGLFVSGTEILKGDPLKRTSCDTCGSIIEMLDLSEREMLMKSKRPLNGRIATNEEGYMLFHKTLVDDIMQSGFSKGLETLPCTVETKNELQKDYVWPYSTVDIGRPSGNIIYETCDACGTGIVKHRRDFITHYSQSAWSENDFAKSGSPGVLIVSRRVYKLLKEKLPSNEFEKLLFKPCQLT